MLFDATIKKVSNHTLFKGHCQNNWSLNQLLSKLPQSPENPFDFDLLLRDLSLTIEKNGVETSFTLDASTSLETHGAITSQLKFDSICLKITKGQKSKIKEASLEIQSTYELEDWFELEKCNWKLSYSGGVWEWNTDITARLFETKFDGSSSLQMGKNEQKFSFELANLDQSIPCMKIPDLLDPENHILELTPRKFNFTIGFEKTKLKQFEVKLTSDVIINKPLGFGELFRLEKGILSFGWDQNDKETKLEFIPNHAAVQPIQWLSHISGFKELLLLSFQENENNQPKTSAFLNLFSGRLNSIQFKVTNGKLGFSAITQAGFHKNSLQKLLPRFSDSSDFSDFLIKLFHCKDDGMVGVKGELSANSEGLHFILKDIPQLVIPDVLGPITQLFSKEFEEKLKELFGKEILTRLNIGSTAVGIKEIAFSFQKEAKASIEFNFALPSKINELFGASKHYLHCYDPSKDLKDQKQLRFKLYIGTKGIGGELLEFSFINFHEINTTFADLIKETEKGILIDLNALGDEGDTDKVELLIHKPICQINLKKGTFHIGGGIHLVSKNLIIPVRSVVKKVLNLVPNHILSKDVKTTITSRVSPTIQIENLEFYTPKTKKLDLHDLEKFLKQFFPLNEHKHLAETPEFLKRLLEDHSEEITSLLPDKLLEYLSIKIPVGFTFDLEILADQTFCFNFEVIKPTEEQKAEGFVDYLQIIAPSMGSIPTHIQGIRFRQFGMGSALFNQAIRVDMDFEYTIFPYDGLAAGIGSELLKKATPNADIFHLILPNGKTMYRNIVIDKFILLVFPQLSVPIPVPLFYDRLAFYSDGIDGTLDFGISFPRPQLQIMLAIRRLAELFQFFTKGDRSLYTKNYGKGSSIKDDEMDAILPTFTLSPFTNVLPGLIGHQLDKNGKKERIKLGVETAPKLIIDDILILLCNLLKFGVPALIKQEKTFIPIDSERKASPMNYLLGYLPKHDRQGSIRVFLFHFLEVNAQWFCITPAEFLSDQNLQDELNLSSSFHSSDDGIILGYYGKVNAFKFTEAKSAFVASMIGMSKFSIQSSFSVTVADIFKLQLNGELGLEQTTELKSHLIGDAYMKMAHLDIFKGRFELVADQDPYFQFQGRFDLFGDQSLIQLYSGNKDGQREEMLGRVGKDGVLFGKLVGNDIKASGVCLKVGNFYLEGRSLIDCQANGKRNHWDLSLNLHGAYLNFSGSYHENILKFEIDAKENILITPAITIHHNKGSNLKGFFKALVTDDKVSLQEFYIDAQIQFLTLESKAKLYLGPEGFNGKLNGDLGILTYDLTWEGTNIHEVSTFELNGDVKLLNNIASLNFNLNSSYEGNKLKFRGNGDFYLLRNIHSSTSFVIEQDDHKMSIHGMLASRLSLIPMILEFQSNASLDLTLDQQNDRVDLFRLSGESDFLGCTSDAFIELQGKDLSYDGSFSVDLNFFHLSGSTSGEIRENYYNFSTHCLVDLHGTKLDLTGTFHNDLLDLSIHAQDHIYITPVITISKHKETDLKGRLKAQFKDGQVSLQECYLNGHIEFLALHSDVRLNLHKEGFDGRLNGGSGILTYDLTWKGDDIHTVNTFKLYGNILLARGVAGLYFEFKNSYEDYKLTFGGIADFHFFGKSRMELTSNFSMENGAFHIDASGELDMFWISGTRLYSGTPSQKEAIQGHINSRELKLTGGLQFHNGIAEMGGTMKLHMNEHGSFSFNGYLQFDKGPFDLFGAKANVNIEKSGNHLCISGTTSTGLDLIPSVLGFSSGASLDIQLNEATQRVDRHKLSGTSYLLGHYANASLDFHQDYIHYEGHFKINLGILRLSADCSGSIGMHHFRLDGKASFQFGIENTIFNYDISEHDFTIDEKGFRLKHIQDAYAFCIGVRPWRATSTYDNFRGKNSDWANNERLSLLIGFNDRVARCYYLIAYRLDGQGEMFYPAWRTWGKDVNTNWPDDLKPFPGVDD